MQTDNAMINNTRSPKVSVIVPVYNTEQYLKRCLDSICFQTLKDIEIICINDASTDDSLHILKEYALLDNRIKIVNFEQNQEVSHARNTGIEMARGEYIGFVDSDDTIESYCYEKLYNSAKESDADIAKGALKAVNGKYSGVRQINTKIKENRAYFWQEFTSAIFRRDFLMKNNLKFSEKIDAWEDPLFALQCAKRANVISFVDDVVYNYITRLDSKSYIADLDYAMQRAQALEAMLDETNTEEEYKIVYLEIIMNLYFAFRSNIKTEEDKRQADTFIQMVLDKRPDYHIERDLNKLYKDWYNRKMLAVTNLVRKKRSYQNV